MKTIWIEGIETAGLINDLAKGFRDKGYRVITFADKNPFYPYTYDIDKFDFINGLKKNELINYPLITKLKTIWINKFKPTKRINYFRQLQLKIFKREVDFFIPIFQSHFISENDFRQINENEKTKLIGYFLGSEIRVYKTFCKQFDVKSEALGSTYLNESVVQKVKKLRAFEKYAHCIFSVPDQMSYAKRPYFHLQLPFDVNKFVFNANQNLEPIIIHCPSNTDFKGTNHILEVLEQLKVEGLLFNFKYLHNLQHNELLMKLSEADILVDELYGHGPGLLSFEAMASGCVVLTRFYLESPTSFKPPVIAVTQNNLKEKLRHVILDLKFRKELTQKGREYFLENNSLLKVITDMLTLMEASSKNLESIKPDYLPNYEKVERDYIDNETKLELEKISV